MEMQSLLKFIREQDERLKRGDGGSANVKERVLARTVKLGEEFGELCDAVLASQGDQRAEKLAVAETENLEKEFADVCITLFLLAEACGISMEEALEKKMETLRQRQYSNGR